MSTSTDWITDYTKSGTESGTINVTFTANTGAERIGTLTVKAAGVEDVVLTIKQAEYTEVGTLEKPYTVAQAIEAIKAGSVAGDVYVKGIISNTTKYNYGEKYNTASFWMSDDGVFNDDLEKDFEAYGVFWLGGSIEEPVAGTDIKANFAIGDEVIIYGQLTKYEKNGTTTYETTNKKAKIYSLNWATSDENGVGNVNYPFNAAGAKKFIDDTQAAMAAAKEKGETLTIPDVAVAGVVSELVSGGFSAQYGNGTFWISDDGSAKDFEAYRVMYLENQAFTEGMTNVAVGDAVILKGQLTKYKETYETSQNKAYLYSLNGVTELPAAEGAITIDGNFDDWADIAGEETPDAICKVMKVTNDAKYFYVYLASEPGSRGSKLWGEEAGYYYLDFDWDNNPETGIDENSNPGFDCWCYLYIFGGTAEAPEIKLHPNGSGNQMSIENITAMGQITDELIQIELSIPREDMVSVAAGTETRILSWRSKDGTKIQMTYTVQ